MVLAYSPQPRSVSYGANCISVCILFGGWLVFNIAQDNLCSSLSPVFLPSYSMPCSCFSAVLLFSVGIILVLLAAQGHRQGIQLLRLYTVLVTEASTSEQSKDGEI